MKAKFLVSSWPCKSAQFWHEPVLPQPNLGFTRRPGLPVLPRARSWDTGRSGTKALTSQGLEARERKCKS